MIHGVIFPDSFPIFERISNYGASIDAREPDFSQVNGLHIGSTNFPQSDYKVMNTTFGVVTTLFTPIS